MSQYPNQDYTYGAASAERAAALANQQRIADLEQQVLDMEAERMTLREQIVAEIRGAAEASASENARIQAFNAEVTHDMTGADIARLAKKYGL